MITHKHILALMLLAGTWMDVATAQEIKDEAAQIGVEQKAQAQIAVEPDNATKQETENKTRLEAEARTSEAKIAEQAKIETEAKAQAEEPVTTKAIAEDPVAAKPQAEEPVTTKAVAEEPVTAKPQAEESVATKAVAEEPVAAKAQAEEPVATKALAEEPVAAKAQAEEPVTTKAIAEDPVAAKPQAEEPVTTKAVAEKQAAQVEVEQKAKVQVTAESGKEPEQENNKEAEAKAKAEADAKAAEQAKLEAEMKAAEKARLEAIAKAKKLRADKVNALLDAVQKAVLKNPDVLSRWDNFKAAIKETDAARGAYFPRVDLSADRGREQYEAFPIPLASMNRSGFTLTLTQMLYDGFATRNEVRRLTNAQLARYYELLDASETAALEAMRAYYDVSRNRKLLELTEENYVTHRTVFEQIKQKVQAGVGRRVDLEQASGRLALSQSNMVLDNANIHDVSARFQRIIGELPPADIDNSASQATQKMLEKMILQNAAGAVLSVGVEFHPAILAAVENVRSAHYDLYERWAKYQPNVNLRLSQTKNVNYTGVVGPTNDTVAEVVLSWNLFNGGTDSARSSQYASRLDAARDQRDKTCRDIRQTLAIAYNDIWKIREQLDFLDQHQLAIEKARGAYQKQFEIGQRSLLDVLDSENELYQAKRSYANAEYDLQIAHARTLAGMGRLVSSLGLARLETSDLPELLGLGSDGPENCPADPPLAANIPLEELNARAIEAAKPPEPIADPDAPASPMPASGVPSISGGAVSGSQAELDAKAAAEAELLMQNPNEIKAAKIKSEEKARAQTEKPAAGN